MASLQIIVQTAADGGTWTLYGRQSGGKWQFHADLDDRSVTPVLGREVHTVSRDVASWDQALELLDQHPWYRFAPRSVDPAFRQALWKAFEDRCRRYGTSQALELKWRDACAG